MHYLSSYCDFKLIIFSQRKADGITFDTNVLEIDENTTIIRYPDIELGACTCRIYLIVVFCLIFVSLLEGEGAVVVVIYMVQQINCIRNKEGDIIEVCV